ncbi:MAG: hypothetical protein ACM3H9_11935 [Rhodospirillaceae bacterium]
MRNALIPIILGALVLSCLPQVAGSAAAQTAPAFTEAGTDATQVAAFLKCLQASVSLGNRLKVASLVQFPLKAWIDGEETLIESESEFHSRYGRIFDADMKKAIADAKVETLSVSQQGVTFDNGRIWFRPVAERKNALKIVSIGEPVQPR